ncbi:oligopeptide/dipeptide ABC transporter ATP-binding protein [Pseudarthrobacter raffinosi]|uniref:oligopeptide/dipeptide ABC transporter ATP-binding protein n=1 Tax=Pseudarthrobacter raffinosi TaxID=2953651 RepID=UPI00208F5220|nr:oligopeptide/dipeptide ABC transporter ATP-binding protein [Pseudarthrobacter sp. MDT3-9]MCO4252134.1 ABC transporter ATP-binding protein [Pseudarthrobacter sp. MDT3-9]
MESPDLLTVSDLEVEFRSGRARVRAVDKVSFRIGAGEVVGLVGESGSGKSTIGRAVLGLTDATAGQVTFDGQDITRLRGRRRRPLASKIQVVFQDPLSSLNPRWTIGRSVAEPLRLHKGMGRKQAEGEAIRMLGLVGLAPQTAAKLPRELSGGQRQRVAIARSMVLSPQLIVCDEPTSALDLSTQSQTLNLLREVHDRNGVSYLFISHDLDVVRYISDRIVVLYRGQIMETGRTLDVADKPLHPYTRVLVGASPVPDPGRQAERRKQRQNELGASTAAVTGVVGTTAAPSGCPFASRCAHVADVCHDTRPRLIETGTNQVACHLYDPESGHPEIVDPSSASPLSPTRDGRDLNRSPAGSEWTAHNTA